MLEVAQGRLGCRCTQTGRSCIPYVCPAGPAHMDVHIAFVDGPICLLRMLSRRVGNNRGEAGTG
jgi:hypothetical protein